MSKVIRLDENLCREASISGDLYKRSTPSQIEYWANIGKAVELVVNPQTLISILQGSVSLEVKPVYAQVIDTDSLFAEVSESSGAYLPKNDSAGFYFEKSLTKPNMIDKVFTDGSRQTGTFRNGKFNTP